MKRRGTRESYRSREQQDWAVRFWNRGRRAGIRCKGCVKCGKWSLGQKRGHMDKEQVVTVRRKDKEGVVCSTIRICRASLVAQWLRICLPMQGTRV